MHIRLLLALGIVSVCVPLKAQWAVVDVDAIAQLTKQVQQGAQQYQVAMNHYNQMKAMAQRVYGLSRYRGPQNVFQAIQYADQYAQLAKWAAGENSGDPNDAADGYNQTTILAKDGTDFLSKINNGLAASNRAMFSTTQVMDGNNIAAIQAVGAIRRAAGQYRAAIDQLEKDAQDESDSAQAQLAVEQRTSNAAVLQLRQTQDTNTLISALLDQQVARTKLTRDQMAADGNAIQAAQQSEIDYQQYSQNAGNSLMNWRWQIK